MDLKVLHAILETLQRFPRNFHKLLNKSVELQTLLNRAVLIWKQNHLKSKAVTAFKGKNVLFLRESSVPVLTVMGRGAGTAPAPCASAGGRRGSPGPQPRKEEGHSIFPIAP